LIGRDIHLHPLVIILAVLAGVELDGSRHLHCGAGVALTRWRRATG
jgi:hypothetical protein